MSKEEEDMTATIEQGVTPCQLTYTKLLIEILTDAHTETCLYTSDQIAVIMRRPHNITAILHYKNMEYEQLFVDCAQNLTNIIEQTINFARMIPGFQNFLIDDQMLLFKAGCFQMSVIRMSRYVDHLTGYVVYGGIMIPSEAFITEDTSEMNLVNNTFQMAKSIADLKLSESELALYSACVLLYPDCPGLKNVLEVKTLFQVMLTVLKSELNQNHKLSCKEDVGVFYILMTLLIDLRKLSVLHMKTVRKFKHSAPDINFPGLYNELFY